MYLQPAPGCDEAEALAPEGGGGRRYAKLRLRSCSSQWSGGPVREKWPEHWQGIHCPRCSQRNPSAHMYTGVRGGGGAQAERPGPRTRRAPALVGWHGRMHGGITGARAKTAGRSGRQDTRNHKIGAEHWREVWAAQLDQDGLVLLGVILSSIYHDLHKTYFTRGKSGVFRIFILHLYWPDLPRILPS